MDCFELLNIEPTKDKRTIKRAYAVVARKYHPEEDPEGFKRIHEAYEEAMEYAKTGTIIRQVTIEEVENPTVEENDPIEDNNTSEYDDIYGSWEQKEQERPKILDLYEEIVRDYKAKQYQPDIKAWIHLINQEKYQKELLELENQAKLLDAIRAWPEVTREDLKQLKDSMYLFDQEEAKRRKEQIEQMEQRRKDSQKEKKNKAVPIIITAFIVVMLITSVLPHKNKVRVTKQPYSMENMSIPTLNPIPTLMPQVQKISVQQQFFEMQDLFETYYKGEYKLDEFSDKTEESIRKEGEDRIEKIKAAASKIEKTVDSMQDKDYQNTVNELKDLYVKACTNMEKSVIKLYKNQETVEEYDKEFEVFETKIDELEEKL